MMNTHRSRVDLFEQKIIFRTARTFFVAIAISAVLAFFGSGILGLSSLSPKELPEPVPPPEVPAPAPLTYADVQAALAKAEESPSIRKQSAGLLRETPTEDESNAAPKEDPLRTRLGELVAELKQLFPPPLYAWDDVYIRVCTIPSAYGCLAYDERLKTTGMSGIVEAALNPFKNLDETVLALEALVRVLKEAPQEQRGTLILPTLKTYHATNRSYMRALSERSQKIEEARFAWEQSIEAEKQEQLTNRTLALQGLAVGFAAIILVSLFLAFLAMERHTRRIEAFASVLERLAHSQAPIQAGNSAATAAETT